MTERRQLLRRTGRAASRSRRPAPAAGVRHSDTRPTPVLPPPDEQTILGFPADIPDEETIPPDGVVDPLGEPTDADPGLYVLRTSDASTGSLLLVAGAAGGMGLFLPWGQHGRELGLTLVRRALDSAGVGELSRSGLLLPLAVAVGGGVLFLLGLLAFRRAPSHRITGVAALLVSLGVAAGIVVRVADLGWDPLRTDPGTLCAVVLAGAGVLGALKAMLTPPEFTTDPG